MVESYPLFPLAEMQLAEEALAAEVQLLGSALVTEMKLLEGALAVATHPSPFKLENFKCRMGVNWRPTAAGLWRTVSI